MRLLSIFIRSEKHCFNPRTHEGCDDIARYTNEQPNQCFNPRTHEGCDLAYVRHKMMRFVFQSTHPRGVRQVLRTRQRARHVFQSTHPRGVRLIRPVAHSECHSFNPRTHEGCDWQKLHKDKGWQSFNPRTHEGCDRCSKRQTIISLCFNPRTHEGCDNYKPTSNKQYLVSIHAPTRGATGFPIHIKCTFKFQSTHPRGVRLICTLNS